MPTSARKKALFALVAVFVVVSPIALFVFDYSLSRSLWAAIGPAVGSAIGIYIANRFIVTNDS